MEDFIPFNRIVKAYRKMQRIEDGLDYDPSPNHSKKEGEDSVDKGDYIEKARRLYEAGKITEGHYPELMNTIVKMILTQR